MDTHDDFAFEPIRGLPARPPKGETILWQGRPDGWRLAREAFALDWIAAYFVLIVLWRGGAGWAEGGIAGALAFGIPYAVMGLVGCLVVLGLAWVQARATVYTVTTARIAMRIGAALTVTLNLPFRQIAAAALDLRRGGTGTIAIRTPGETRLSYLVCWPHVRPWHMRRTEPALRCIPDAARVARILADAAETRMTQPEIARTAPAAAVAAE
ncbi:MAG: photosynthetic complex putative assembly protein PuhB [Gemmobacter sp.]